MRPALLFTLSTCYLPHYAVLEKSSHTPLPTAKILLYSATQITTLPCMFTFAFSLPLRQPVRVLIIAFCSLLPSSAPLACPPCLTLSFAFDRGYILQTIRVPGLSPTRIHLHPNHRKSLLSNKRVGLLPSGGAFGFDARLH